MSSHRISVRVNGRAVDAEIESRRLLVDFLREDLRLTGPHIGCDTSHCGACTVMVDGCSVKSCTYLAVQTDGREVLTIEGLAREGEFHPLQQAFLDKHAFQCGYCTPGMVMSALHLLSKNPRPSEEAVRRGIAGNLCRCTGYRFIVDAILDAAVKMEKS